MGEQRITFSISGLLLIVASVLSIVVLWQLQSLLIILMISVVLAASISPLVETAEMWHIPRWLGTIVVYLTLLSGLTGVGLLLGPAVTEQIQLLVKRLPVYAEKLIAVAEDTITRWNDIPSDIFEFFDVQQFTSWLFRSSQQLVLRSYSITRGILGGVISLILSLFISGYMVADSQTLVRSVVRLFPQPWEERLAAQVPIISYRMGSYIRGRLLVSLILGIATTVGLGFLGLREFSLGVRSHRWCHKFNPLYRTSFGGNSGFGGGDRRWGMEVSLDIAVLRGDPEYRNLCPRSLSGRFFCRVTPPLPVASSGGRYANFRYYWSVDRTALGGRCSCFDRESVFRA